MAKQNSSNAEMKEQKKMKQNSTTALSEIPEGLEHIQQDILKLTLNNYKNQSELKDFRKQTNKKTKEQLLELLDILDAFDRVFDNIIQKEDRVDKQMKIWVGNFKSVRRLLWKHLKAMGIREIENPERKIVVGVHVIEDTKAAEGLPDEMILEIIQKGYLWNNEVIRKEKVIVVKN